MSPIVGLSPVASVDALLMSTRSTAFRLWLWLWPLRCSMTSSERSANLSCGCAADASRPGPEVSVCTRWCALDDDDDDDDGCWAMVDISRETDALLQSGEQMCVMRLERAVVQNEGC